MKQKTLIKAALIVVMILVVAIFIAGCGSDEQANDSETQVISSQHQMDTDDAGKGNGTEPVMIIDGEKVAVDWEDNGSAKALLELAGTKELSINMSAYGGFEQVGDIGSDLPSNDRQMTTSAGDIVLYQGNQMVIFYGSNSWEYTSLGKITDRTADELEKLLGKDTVTVTLEAR